MKIDKHDLELHNQGYGIRFTKNSLTDLQNHARDVTSMIVMDWLKPQLSDLLMHPTTLKIKSKNIDLVIYYKSFIDYYATRLLEIQSYNFSDYMIPVEDIYDMSYILLFIRNAFIKYGIITNKAWNIITDMSISANEEFDLAQQYYNNQIAKNDPQTNHIVIKNFSFVEQCPTTNSAFVSTFSRPGILSFKR